MDAAQKTHTNTRILLLIALAVIVATPGWSQTPAFSLSTTSVSLNQSVSGADVTVNSTGDPITFGTSIAYAADGGNGAWLRVTPSGNTTPTAIGLNIAIPPTLAATYSATVTLTSTSPVGITATITVTFANGSGGGGTGTSISISPSTVSIGTTGSNIGFGQATVSTASISPITLSTAVTSGSWLSSSLTSSTISASLGTSTLILQANPLGLSNGVYQGTVTVTPSTGSAVTVTVNFTVGGGGGSGGLTANPSTVSLSYSTGGSFPFQFVSLLSTSGSTTYTATSSTNWLSINNSGTIASGTVAGGLTVSLGSSLSTGSYTGTVQVTDNLNGNTTITVNLSVNGGSSTGLAITPASLSFTSVVGGGSQFSNLTVSSTSGGAFTATSNASWLGATVTSGSPIASNTAGNVQVTIIPGGLSNGTYNGQITVTVGSQSQAIPVTLTVGSGGGGGGTTTGVAPTSLSLNWQVGTPSAFVNRPILSITGPSGAWSSTITYGQGTGWLSLNPSTGSTLPAQATVIADPAGAGLTAGNYTATITITTPGGTQNVNVNLGATTGAVLLSTPGGLIFNYQTGGSLPQAQSVFVSSSDGTPFEIAGAVTSNVPWLTISTIQTGQKSFSVSADPSALSAGVNTGTITVGPTAAGSLTIPVVIVINNGNGGGGSTGPLSFSPSSLTFSSSVGSNPASQSITVNASSQTTFTVSGNQTWLSVSPTSGATSSVVTASVNSSGLPQGTYNGTLTFSAGGSSQFVPVSLTVGTGGGGGTGTISVSPSNGLTFTGQTGAGTLPTQTFQVTASGSSVSFNANATTTSGGTWLSVSPSFGTATGTALALTVTVNTAGLAGGTYQGNIQVLPTNGGAAVNVPITLTLTSPTVSAPTTPLTFTYRAGGANPPSQPVAVSGSGLNFTATASSTGNWLVVSPTSGTAPATVNVSINGAGLAAATYNGTVTIAGASGANGSSVIPVTLTVTAPLPTITKLGNAGSYAAANIAPGEIITLFGTDLGPATPVGLTLDSTGKVATTLGGVQVTVGGFPAPMIYVSGTQVSAVVPYELAQFVSTNVLVKFLGQSSNGVAVNIATAAPGLFTLNASGTGPGAILNQNNSTNSPSNPATRGDTIVVYLTGEGQTNPLGVTGKVTTVSSTPPLTPAPLLRPSVTIGGVGADFSFAGEAPGFVSGVLQMNIVIPQSVSAGDQPIVVSIGGIPSQNGVTVSVR